MQLRADALRFVLAQGLPAVIEVTGGSMAPTVTKGEKVDVAPLAEGDGLAPGDVVLLATRAGVLLLHRVMSVFSEGDARFVVHQGDASGSTFAVAARRDVLARMTGFAVAARSVPRLEALDADARERFRRRRLACEGFVVARRLAHALRLSPRGPVRRCAQLYRRFARALLG